MTACGIWGEHALHGRLHFIDAVVDHAVHAHIYVAAGGAVARGGIGRTLKPMMIALEVAASITSPH